MYELTYQPLPDVEAYLKRMNYTGSREVCLQTLNDLIYTHQCNVPFENLDCCDYHIPISLDINHLYEKVVLKRRGGYCFELNGLFMALLRAMGFDAWSAMCRVAATFTELRPIKHRGIMVRLDGKLYYCDVGLGGPMAPFAVALDGTRQTVRGETYWIEELAEEGWYLLRRLSGAGLADDGLTTGVERNVVVFSKQAFMAEDFEAYSYQCWAFPDSRFVTRRNINIRTADGYINLVNDELTVCKNRVLTTTKVAPEELETVLRDIYGLEKCEYSC